MIWVVEFEAFALITRKTTWDQNAACPPTQLTEKLDFVCLAETLAAAGFSWAGSAAASSAGRFMLHGAPTEPLTSGCEPEQLQNFPTRAAARCRSWDGILYYKEGVAQHLCNFRIEIPMPAEQKPLRTERPHRRHFDPGVSPQTPHALHGYPSPLHPAP